MKFTYPDRHPKITSLSHDSLLTFVTSRMFLDGLKMSFQVALVPQKVRVARKFRG